MQAVDVDANSMFNKHVTQSNSLAVDASFPGFPL